MALEMKSACEKCGKTLAPDTQAYICTYECTFCHTCTEVMGAICPNCRGELVRRPRRKTLAAETTRMLSSLLW